MDPQLLAVKIADLQHAVLRKEWVRMVPSTLASNQASKPLLVPQQGAPKGVIPRTLEVPPHHEAVLEVGKDQPIIE